MKKFIVFFLSEIYEMYQINMIDKKFNIANVRKERVLNSDLILKGNFKYVFFGFKLLFKTKCEKKKFDNLGFFEENIASFYTVQCVRLNIIIDDHVSNI